MILAVLLNDLQTLETPEAFNQKAGLSNHNFV